MSRGFDDNNINHVAGDTRPATPSTPPPTEPQSPVTQIGMFEMDEELEQLQDLIIAEQVLETRAAARERSWVERVTKEKEEGFLCRL